MSVEAAAGQKGDDGQRHGDGRDGKADGPRHRVLDVHDNRDSQAAAPIDGKVEPIEEALLLQAVLQGTYKRNRPIPRGHCIIATYHALCSCKTTRTGSTPSHGFASA